MDSRSTEIQIDADRIRSAMRECGLNSVKDLADTLGVHRNTVSNYLTGKTTIPDALARMLELLNLSPADVLSLRRRRRLVPGLAVSNLVDSLHEALPGAAFVLFGSRARGTAKQYSDYDLGFFTGRPHDFATYSRLLDLVADWNEESLLTAQLVALDRADQSFLRDIAEDLVFLGGSPKAWCGLLEETGLQLHE